MNIPPLPGKVRLDLNALASSDAGLEYDCER